eukprot:2502704-Pleurochrysis_carterae.AAC.1
MTRERRCDSTLTRSGTCATRAARCELTRATGWPEDTSLHLRSTCQYIRKHHFEGHRDLVVSQQLNSMHSRTAFEVPKPMASSTSCSPYADCDDVSHDCKE